jgi:dienelactone hydrolase
MAGDDDFFAPTAAHVLEAKLQKLGKDVQLTVHEGAGHAFMNPHNSLGNLDEALAAKVWAEATAFLHDQLG